MDQQLKHVIFALCEDVGSPRALAVKLLVDAEEWIQLQQLKVNPHDYNWWQTEALHGDLAVTELLRKCKLPSGVDTAAVAVRTFWACEAQNKRTNHRLNRFVKDRENLSPEDVPVAQFFDCLRKNVKSVLGNLPQHLVPRFSGGATYADTGKLTTIPDKMSSHPTCYATARDVILPFWKETSWYRALREERPWQTDPNTVRGNVFFTVPKDGKTDRGCCKEASLPVSFQLDVGRLMRARLTTIGITLQTGQETHQRLAKEGSLTGYLATDDMSNASDTISRFLVEVALGDVPLWFDLLDSLRARETRIDNKWVTLEKFSSMGNGFTFELETLLFACIARTVIALEGGDPDEVSAYGDDLIYPARFSRSVRAALTFCGLTVNENKSFNTGDFRESCGGDFFCGVPVRATYMKELPCEPQHYIALANNLRRVANADGAPPTRWRIYQRAWLRVLACLPATIRRLRGPSSLGDVVIHDHPRFWATRPVRPRKGIEWDGADTNTWDSVQVRGYCPIAEVIPWHHWSPATQLGCCVVMSDCERGVTPRGGVTGYAERYITVPGSSWLPS